jgi:hypothetical protein
MNKIFTKVPPAIFHTKGTIRKTTHLRMITEVLKVFPSSHPWTISTGHKVFAKIIFSNIPLNRTDR